MFFGTTNSKVKLPLLTLDEPLKIDLSHCLKEKGSLSSPRVCFTDNLSKKSIKTSPLKFSTFFPLLFISPLKEYFSSARKVSIERLSGMFISISNFG